VTSASRLITDLKRLYQNVCFWWWSQLVVATL
jgi:hypothetical protein